MRHPAEGAAATYDVEAVRDCFPALRPATQYRPAAHFEGPGGSLVPEVVGKAVANTLVAAIANRGRTTAAERLADDTVVAARQAIADLVGGQPRGVVFGRSMTSLTFEFSRTLAKTWRPGDEVVVSRLDHDGNVRPWIYAAESAGATIRWIDFDPHSGELTTDHVAAVLTDRTRLVALTGASNLIGTRPELATIAPLVHEAGALFFVDGVHLTAHAAVDVSALGADVYACSPYKFLGPHCGVLVAAPELLESLEPDKLLPSSNAVPERFELGTLPYELLAGVNAAVDFLAGLGGPSGIGADRGASRRDRLVASLAAVEAHEDRLRADVEQGLAELPSITRHSRAAHRTPTLLITFADRDPAEVRLALAAAGVNAPNGSFYAIEPSRRLGLGDAGGLRIGLAPYTNSADVQRLLTALKRLSM